MNVRQNQVPHSEFRIPRLNNRRGVTLLFVISMIVLFLLMGTTFVVVSNDYLRAAKRRNASGGVNAGAVTREQGNQLVMQSFLDAVRGPSLDNVNNPLRGHDLLGDMYGYGIEATISDDPATPPILHASEHFVEFTVGPDRVDPAAPDDHLATSTLANLGTSSNRLPVSLPAIPGHFNGQVLTVVSGDLDGLTMRVMQYEVTATGGGPDTEIRRFIAQVLNPSDFSLASIGDIGGETILINGRAFAGTGTGRFDPSATVDMPALDMSATQPNQVGRPRSELTGRASLDPSTQQAQRDNNGNLFGYLGRHEIDIPTGALVVNGAAESFLLPNHASINEPWDAADDQNMFLALIRNGAGNDSLAAAEITPSFYRDTGTRRNFNAFATDANAAVARADIMVDNDNDGIDDGIWIDTGLPVQSTPDGEYMKPLVSYLILDMDGRLNLNAHGNLNEAAIVPGTDLLGTGTLPTGMGFGPAEVSLGTLISAANLPEVYDQRYGSDRLPGFSGLEPDEQDNKAIYKQIGYPDGPIGDLFFSEFDWYGRYSLGFMGDPADPLFATMPSMVPANPADVIMNPLDNSPYEVDLVGGSSSDDLFSPSDLERFLRPQDRDSVLLGQRLEDVMEAQLNSLGSDAERNLFRKLLTTASFEVPAIPTDVNQLLFEILEGPALFALDPTFNTPLTEVEIEGIQDEMEFLLSPEVRRGLPMNLNRMFGDGIDDPGNVNGVVDEPFEQQDDVVGLDSNTTISLDLDNNGAADVAMSGLNARNNFARRLFVLMILITEYQDRDRDGTTLFSRDGMFDAGDFFDFDGSDTPDGAAEVADIVAHRRMLAQWCVNVVDFRDPDSIMTGMEFDLNPFDAGGWEVDGDLSNGDAQTALPFPGGAGASFFVAWGVERPELLITETSAFHDVRLQDTELEAGPDNAMVVDDPPPMTPDEDLDSAFLPVASAFFELTNPQVVRDQVRNETAPAEMYNNGLDGVDLQKKDGEDDDAPVWRLVVVDPDFDSSDVRVEPAALRAEDIRNSSSFEEDVDTAIASNSETIVRYVYFAEPNLAGPQFDGQKVYYPSNQGSPNTAVLEPGQFAVIGSAGKRDGAEFTTYFGRTLADRDRTTTGIAGTPLSVDAMQKIVINPDEGEVTWHPDGSSGTTEEDVIAIAIDENAVDGTRSLGISDPVPNRYREIVMADPSRTIQPVSDGDGLLVGGLDFAFDQPLDEQVINDDNIWASHPLNRRGLFPGYRVVLLQRLANPLSAYDVDTNPYRTVDSSAVDLFVFNGLMTKAEEDAAKAGTRVTHEDTSLPIGFGTFERGERQTAVDEALLWPTSVMGESDAPDAVAIPTGQVVALEFRNTLGFMNDYFTNNNTGMNPFPWLTWNNRPFANQYEIANVPYTSAAWLTRAWGAVNDASQTADQAYDTQNHSGVEDLLRLIPEDDDSQLPMAEQEKLREVYHPNAFGFTHLLNFAAEDAATGAPHSDLLYGVFDFLEVPSRFAGTEQYVNTAVTELTDNGANPTAAEEFGYYLSAPFDELSEYRYPGKVNLNTIPSDEVWNALIGSKTPNTPGPYGAAGTGASFEEFNDLLMDNPVRPAAAANFTNKTTVPGPADSGLFRSDASGRRASRIGASLLDFQSDEVFNSGRRNAYFRNGIRQKLGGVATNRSSVFAIWVTVGYFEWDNEMNELRGPEYGTETGTVQRSRGFFLFDRSIPMAYEPGEDHNVDRGILLQSLIE